MEKGADKSNSLFHHTDFILHKPFDETGEQTWVESGDLRPTEACKPLKPSALLMNSHCNHTGRSTVCTELIDPVSSIGTCELYSDPVTSKDKICLYFPIKTHVLYDFKFYVFFSIRAEI